VKTWLSRILVTQAAKCLRDRQRRRKHEAGNAAAQEPAAQSCEAHRSMDVHQALDKLAVEHREILVLREFEQLSYQEIAEVLDVAKGTVESRLFRAREALREVLKAYEA